MQTEPTAERYLELLKQCLTGSMGNLEPLVEVDRATRKRRLLRACLEPLGVVPARQSTFDPVTRHEGRDFPLDGETMIGRMRIDNVHFCAQTVLTDQIAGDFVEAGVWRGGASIFMRGVLAAHGDLERRVWVADSFEGLPKVDVAKYPADAGLDHFHYWDVLAVSLEEVRSNFAKYHLLDDQVMFVKGWFKDTLPGLSAERWSLIRLDGDLYESTMDSLEALYANLSPGGFVIVDDYYSIEACQLAVDTYRAEHGITEPIERIDWTGAFWRKG